MNNTVLHLPSGDFEVVYADKYRPAPKPDDRVLNRDDDDDWDCGCPDGAEDKCVSVVCPRRLSLSFWRHPTAGHMNADQFAVHVLATVTQLEAFSIDFDLGTIGIGSGFRRHFRS